MGWAGCLHSADAEAFRTDLYNIARTTLSSKILTAAKEYFSELAVDAVLRIKVRARCPPPLPASASHHFSIGGVGGGARAAGYW